MPPFTIRRTPATVQCYTEPLEIPSDAIPLDMILAPGGTFTMGSPDTEPQRKDNEGPQHQVTVSSFFMGRYPVTQAQWRTVAQMDQVKQELNADPSNFKGPNRPVEQISWYEAIEFCDRLAHASGRPYRLPSEAEWEYACRAGTTTPFSFGKTLTPELANYFGPNTYNGGPEGVYREQTTPVNEFDVANAFGLCDMHGNVLEWGQDHWRNSYNNSPENGSAWLSEDESEYRVLRGGSWDFIPRNCRSASRDYGRPGDRNINLGFRVVCVAP